MSLQPCRRRLSSRGSDASRLLAVQEDCGGGRGPDRPMRGRESSRPHRRTTLTPNPPAAPCCCADQVIAHQRGPHFAADHRRRLAADVSQVQRLFDRADGEFRIPAKAVELREVFAAVSVVVDERRNDGQDLGAATGDGHAKPHHAERQGGGNRRVGRLVHPRGRRLGPDDHLVDTRLLPCGQRFGSSSSISGRASDARSRPATPDPRARGIRTRRSPMVLRTADLDQPEASSAPRSAFGKLRPPSQPTNSGQRRAVAAAPRAWLSCGPAAAGD